MSTDICDQITQRRASPPPVWPQTSNRDERFTTANEVLFFSSSSSSFFSSSEVCHINAPRFERLAYVCNTVVICTNPQDISANRDVAIKYANNGSVFDT